MPHTLNAAFLDTISGQLIYEEMLNEQCLRVFQNNSYRWFTLGGDVIQAIMSLKQPEKALLPVPQAMLMFLLWQPTPKSILNLGLGAAGLERALAAYGSAHITAVEKEQTVIAMARNHFNLPSKVLPILAKAEAFIENTQANYDVILCDMFANEIMPNCLEQEIFYRNLSLRLNEDGSILINLVVADNAHLIRLIAMIKRYFSNIAFLDFTDFRNILLIARHAPLPDTKTLKENCILKKFMQMADFSKFIERIRHIPS